MSNISFAEDASFTDDLSDPRETVKPVCHSLGVAGILAGFAWLIQTCGLNGMPVDASWIIVGAMIAGAGAGFLVIAHTDVVL